MSQRFWKPGAGGAWSNPSVWLGRVPPLSHDIAAFATTAGHDDGVAGDGAAGMVLVSGDGSSTVTLAGALGISGLVWGASGATIGVPSLVVDHGGRLVIATTAKTVAASGIEIGRSAWGSLAVAGRLSSGGTVVVGDLASGVGAVAITAGGNLTAQTLVVGNHGSGTLTIDTGAGAFSGDDVDVANTIYVGRYAGSHGVINLVHGNLQPEGSQGGLVIGSGGSGVVLVAARAGIAGGYDVQSHGEIRLDGGELGGFFGTIDAGGVVDGWGQVTTLSVVNDGVIRATGHLLLNSLSQGEGPDTISGSGTLEVGAHATLDTTNVFLSGQTMRFVGVDGTLAVPSAFHGTLIEGFAIGDVIRPLEVVTAIMFHASTDELTLSSHGVAVDTLDFAGSFAGEQFVLGHDLHGTTITLAGAGHALG